MNEQSRPHPRQMVRYAFYKALPEWRAIGDEERQAARKELADLFMEGRERFPMLRTYSTVGMRADADMLAWMAAPSLEDVEGFEAQIRRTQMGRYLATAHSFLAMTKRSPYEDRLDPSRREKLQVKPGRAKYLFV